MMKVLSFVLFACIIATAIAGTFTLAPNEIPQWDLCKFGGDIFSCSGHGYCSGPSGKCICTDGYTGRDCSVPPGGFGYNTPASVTQFCQLETGGCAPGMCVGGGKLDDTSLPPGVDGVAAVNPTIYGSRYAYAPMAGAGSPKTLNGMYSFVGESCGTCWKLTRKSVSIVVTVVDRCAGYCRATVGANQVCSASSPQGAKECGECIQSNHTSVPQCSCLSPSSTNNNGWCDGYKSTGAHCDWCASNDHPHFDLDITAQLKICGEAAGDGFCFLDSFQMVACPDLVGPWPNGYPNGTASPASGKTSGSSSSSSSSGSNSASNNGLPTTCPYTTGDNVCRTATEGSYMCNGCNLTMCHYGKFYNLGCPLGTSCKDGACEIAVTCDPLLSACAAGSTPAASTPAAASTQAPASQAQATQTPTKAAPQTAATQKPVTVATSAPTQKPATVVTSAPTQKPATVAPTSAPATPAPSTPAPSKIGQCGSRKRSVEDETIEYVFEPVLVQAEQVVERQEETGEIVSSGSFVVPTFLAAVAAFALYL